MSRFDSYFFMQKEEDVIEYVKEKLDFFEKDAVLTCKEIGDGNINYVYRVMDEKTGKSVIVKHAGPTCRSAGERELSTDRNRIEADLLILERKLAPEHVPEVYLCDTTMSCLVMEDGIMPICVTPLSNMRYSHILQSISPPSWSIPFSSPPMWPWTTKRKRKKSAPT